MTELETKLNQWCEQLAQYQQEKYYACVFNQSKFRYSKGKKYYKIIEQNYLGIDRSVFAFVDYEGNIYKPSNWSKPYPQVRARIDDSKLPLEIGQLYATR